MNDSRFAWKVGLFVFVGLALTALLILNFSKGITLFRPSIKVHVSMPTVAGLKPAADVMLAGVPIGKVTDTTLSLDGKSVDITVEILAKYKIRRDAKFHIDALGFLGDQYVEVTPAEETASNQAEAILQNGDRVVGDAPFNMQEAVRSTSGLLDQAGKTMKDLDQAITNVNRTVLAGDTLANFSLALSNLESVAVGVAAMATEVRGMLDSNVPPIHIAVTNLETFSGRINSLAIQLGQFISTNGAEATDAVKNFHDTSLALKQMAEGLQAGQGPVGALLKDENMKAELAGLISNANNMSQQFSTFGEHLNERGIFRMLLKPKPPDPASPPH